jgi:hypothetical protein
LRFFPWFLAKELIHYKGSSEKGFSFPSATKAYYEQLVKGNELQQEGIRVSPLPEVAFQWIPYSAIFKRSIGNT